MCDNWRKEHAKEVSCEGVVLDSGDGEFIVKGHVNSLTSNPTIIFWAPNPPTYCTSYTGSGLPYPNSEIAYENTPNRGAVVANSGHFKFRVRYPCAHYAGLGSLYLEPYVNIKVCEEGSDGKIQQIKLGNGIPFRSLTYPPTEKNTRARKNVMFYAGRDKLPIRSQEQILRDSGFPEENKVPQNFWGKAVPHE